MLKKKQSTGIPLSASEKALSAIAYVFMTLLALIAVLPCMHVISKSISNGADVIAGNVNFFPKGFQLDTITYLLTETPYLTALKNSIVVTFFGTLLSLFTTITTAYPLSKTHFKGRRFIALLYVFSMVFYGGMIPAYMVVRTLGILDTYLACILPFAIVQFNMFIVKNYFESLPESIEESARIDGAGDIRTLISIVCPMSKPVIATVGLLYAVTYWNNYFHAMMYTKSTEMNTLQVYLYNLIQNGQAVAEGVSSGTYTINVTSPGLNAAAVTLTLIPMLLLYPFVSRYMIQGITIGSVKG